MATYLEGMEEIATTKGFVMPGIAYHVTPFNSRTIFDFFTPVGTASSLFTSFLFYLGKRGFTNIHRLEDWMEVSPVNAPYYQLTIQQKQQLERQIKEGLASISQAAADLELLLHDLRKYKEFLDYLEAVKKGSSKNIKDESVKADGIKAEQTLKSIFIDEVDIHTDLPQTPIALRSIVSRWPTIISDFMKLKSEDTDQKKISEAYGVSEAEGVVLATKNKLYDKWKRVFQDTVTKRYESIQNLVTARRRSVKEYKNMLRPYIQRYRSIREMGETPESRGMLKSLDFYRPAGQAVSVEYTMTWAWRPIGPAEFAKASRGSEAGEKYSIKNWRSLPIAKGFKAMVMEELQRNGTKNFDDAGLTTISGSPTGAEPLDDFVFKNVFGKVKNVLGMNDNLENFYGGLKGDVKFSIIDILKERETFCKTPGFSTYYFMTMEMGTLRSVIRTPGGVEVEDFWIEPFFMYFDTQNVILLRMLEILAKKKQDEAYMAEMLGESSEGKMVADLIKEEYPHLFGDEEYIKKIEAEKGKEDKKEKKGDSLLEIIKKGIKALGIDVWFVKPGPYETHFDDRVTGIWFPDMQASVYSPSVGMLKAYMQVPGFKAAT